MCCIPGGPRPGSQQAQAHLSILIQVGIEPDPPPAGGQELHLGRAVGVAAWQEDVKQEAAIGIGSV